MTDMAIIEDPEGNEAAALASSGVSFMSRRVLEIGCGDGRLTKYFARVAASVLAIDPDEKQSRSSPGICRWWMRVQSPSTSWCFLPTASISSYSPGRCDESRLRAWSMPCDVLIE
jgi:hypothetical protein